MGMTENESTTAGLFRIIERRGGVISEMDGAVREDKRVSGTYIHGLFEAGGFRRFFLNQLRKTKGLTSFNEGLENWDRSVQFDRLAEMIREHVKTELLYEWLGILHAANVET